MNDLALEDRPREKLRRAGVGSLGDNELLAVVLGHGRRGATALSVANRALGAAGGVHGLTRVGLDELAAVPGMGPVQACRTLAAIELGRRTLATAPPARQQILSARDAAALLLPRFGAYPVERFGVLLLDTKMRVIRAQLLTVGSQDASVVDTRDVFREAVRASASALVAFHNHPSGDVKPSADDLELTVRLVAAGDIVGVQVVDHLILADTDYCSLMERARKQT